MALMHFGPWYHHEGISGRMIYFTRKVDVWESGHISFIFETAS